METITKYTVTEILDRWSSQTGVKMTQSNLADKLGISKQQIGQLKNKPIPAKYNSKIESFIKNAKKDGVTLDFYPDVKASCGTGNYKETEIKELQEVVIEKVKEGTHRKFDQYVPWIKTERSETFGFYSI